MTSPNEATPQSSVQDSAITKLYELGSEAFGYLIERDRDERRWRLMKRLVLSAITLLAIGGWIALYAPMFGIQSGPTETSVGVVPIQGDIGAAAGASADGIVPAIDAACKSKLTKVVVLRITSPGGSPTDAERISGALAACRPSGPDAVRKPVIAQIEGVGASAAYLIAVQADEIYATRYSMVGSIGAVMRTVEAADAIAKLGLREKVFASGGLKAGNSPWSKNTPEQDALAQSLVDGIAQMFVEEVKVRRGSKLKPTPDMFSGRVWLAPEAKRLGLIDGTSTFEQLKESRFKDMAMHEYSPKRTLQDALGLKSLAHEVGMGLSSGLAGARWE